MVVNPTLTQPTEASIAQAREQYRVMLVQDEEETVGRLLTAYTRLLQDGSPINTAMNTLVNRITSMDEPNMQDVRDLSEYQGFLATVKEDMNGFSAIYRNEVANLTENAAGIASQSALAMAQANVPIAAGEIGIAWNQPDPKALADLISVIDNESWRIRQGAYGENAAGLMADTILSMVAQGKHSALTARLLRDSMDIPFAWADNTVRTAQVYAYRNANHLSYASNPEFIEGWVWQADLGGLRACLSCVSKHGQFFTLDQTLNDHHRGRCTPLPKVKGTKWHDSMTRGEDWFRSLTPKEHQVYRKTIGNNALYDAVYQREVGFDRLSVPYEDSVYGEMLRQTTYQEAQR